MHAELEKRRKRRFSVKGLTISVNGKTYRVCNINEDGVGFLINTPKEIQIGAKIKPMIVNGNLPVRLTGIPRHISRFHPSKKHLHFKSGWVCGSEFTTGHDREAWKLLQKFITEWIDEDIDETD